MIEVYITSTYFHSLAVNGGWSSWNYGTCSKTCGSGIRISRRSCSRPYRWCGGRTCSGDSQSSNYCFIRNCPGMIYFTSLFQ